MASVAHPILAETEGKLAALEARLLAWLGTDPGWKLLGKVKELLERCHILLELGEHASARAISELVVEATAAERISLGAFPCVHHPLAVAARTASAPLCRPCYDRLLAILDPSDLTS